MDHAPNPTYDTVTVPSEAFGPITTHYQVYGNGDTPLLLLHGLGTSSYTWRRILEPLAEHYTLYMPDLPGSGRSPALTSSPDSEGLAHWVEGFVKALKIKRCPCVASDLGAYLAMRCLLIKRRGKPPISTLAAIHPPVFPDLRLYAAKTLLHIPGAADLAAWFIRNNPETWIQALVSSDELFSDAMRHYSAPLTSYAGSMNQVLTLRDTLDPVALETFFAAFRLRKYTDEAFPTPLMFLYGDRDPIIAPSHGERLREHLRESTRLVTVPGSSRLIQEDAPDRLVAHLITFLAPGAEPVKKKKNA